MPMKAGREYRVLQDFSLVPRDEGAEEYRVKGTAVVFNTPTCLYEFDGVKYYEVIDRHAFDECDMSDVIFNYNHGGKVVARLRNKTLALQIDDTGLHMEADLSGTAAGRELYEEIDGGYIDKMSFSFVVAESKYDVETHTRTITKIRKLYDVSAVDIPAYEETSISARSFFEEEYSKEIAALEQAERRRRLIARTRT
ncbi:MAG: HK97 family phage prohead protease [Acutalibacter sp.]|nr:HK97 family phage prohead protease [Acutalibacter sp.]